MQVVSILAVGPVLALIARLVILLGHFGPIVIFSQSKTSTTDAR